MDLIAGSAGRAFGNEFGAHAAGLRIERRGIKIGNPIEQTTLADELVERLALGVLLGRLDRIAEVSIGAQSGPRIGVQKGPPLPTME